VEQRSGRDESDQRQIGRAALGVSHELGECDVKSIRQRMYHFLARTWGAVKDIFDVDDSSGPGV